jgi:hypothetical protein
MPLNPPSYDDLRLAVIAVQGKSPSAAAVDGRCLEMLVNLGIVVHIGGGLIEATSHGQRLHTRLQRGEHLTELDPAPPPPSWST